MGDTLHPRKNVVNNFSSPDGEISPRPFAMLPRTVGKKKPQKRVEDDRTPLQVKAEEIVDRNKAQGWTKTKISKRAGARRRPLATSTINAVLKGHDPSIKTLEKFALGYDEDPIELFRLNLDEPPEPDEFSSSPVYRIFSLLRNIIKNGSDVDQLRANERIEETVDFLRKLEKTLDG